MLHTCCYWGIPYITAEKISHMPFYYHRNQLGTETAEKEVYRALTELGGLSPSEQDLGGRSGLRKYLDYKAYLDWLNDTGKCLFL